MIMKFQNKSIALDSGRNIGSCARLVTYLKHEDNDRLELGKEILPFFTPDGIKVSDAEVITKIDRNISGLCKKDIKFYHIVAAFSEEEVNAMGSTEEDLTISAMEFAKQISNAYAKNFHKDGIDGADDILIFWKIHFTRDDNDVGQMHLHGIVSHKDKSNKIRISPCTNHRNTRDGPITGGFNKNEMCQTCETLFDMTYDYHRSATNSFGYFNAIKNGTAEDKKEALAAKVAEETKTLTPSNNALLSGMKKAKIDAENEIEDAEINQALQELAFEENVTEVFTTATTVTDIKKGLFQLSCTIKIIRDTDGNIIDFKIIKQDKSFNMSERFSRENSLTILDKWGSITGQMTKAKADALKAAEAEKVKQHTYKNVIRHNPKF